MPRIKASGAVGVQVEGLAELNRALRALGGREFQAELRDAGREIAGEVAGDAQGIASGLGGVAAKTAPSISAAAGFTSAGVSLGGSAYPFAMGAEFGGQRLPTTQQFKPWKGSGSGAGYFVYESIRRNSDRIGETYLDAVDKVIKRHNLD